ncbi:rhodanese-like domain-containing protein [Chloroflexota bacterium]
MKEITRDELKTKLARRPDLKLVFTLGEWQYDSMHIPGSVNVPCSDRLYSSVDALTGLAKDDEIVVYCSNETCWASVSMYHYLVRHGYTNVSRFAGGLLEWDEAGLPLDGQMAKKRPV